MAKPTKKQKALEGKVDALKLHAVDEAIKTVRELASDKFDETLEIAMNLGVDPRHADLMVLGVVTLPAGTGKDVKVAEIGRAHVRTPVTNAHLVCLHLLAQNT